MPSTYDLWKTTPPDYGPEPLECGCCSDGEIHPIHDADEDGAYTIVPPVCSTCDELGCTPDAPCVLELAAAYDLEHGSAAQ